MGEIKIITKKNFWLSKKVLITGDNGFVGTWLNYLLKRYKANTYGISLKNNKNKINKLLQFNKNKSFVFNINNYSKLKKTIKKIKPKILIHLAAQSLVLKSFEEPNYTYETNIMGTLNILRVIKEFNFIKTAIFFTTDKVYENSNKKKFFKENNILNGDDPYSGSKAASEIVINSFVKSFLKKKNIIVLRAGNIIGGGDYNSTRLIPDIMSGYFNNRLVKIRSKNSIRPWQHILDVIFIIKKIVEKIHVKKNCFEIFNIGPRKSTLKVFQILNLIKKEFKIKIRFLKSNSREKKFIFLNSEKIFKKYNLKNKLNIQESINLTTKWYKKFYLKKINIKNIFDDDIKFYESKK
jgi:CDP-glucose 4,6-dehydratase